MKVAIWRTGHIIADTVAEHLARGFNGLCELKNSQIHPEEVEQDAVNIGYGILRGTGEVFHRSNKWFNIDNGYFNPGHFNGYYRISYKGTQAKWHDDIPKQDIDFKLEDWDGHPYRHQILIIPPSQDVIDFFGLPKENDWITDAAYKVYNNGYRGDMSVRRKGDNRMIDWMTTKGVITFNSSIGWQALQRGIPVYSDPDHSIIGSYYKAKMQNSIDFLSDEYKAIDREPLYRAMAAHQFKLSEISEGKAWGLIQHYLSKYS